MSKLKTDTQLPQTIVMRCLSNSLELWGIKFKRIFRNRKYDVYCPYCSSCGETGCCSPTICINHSKGFYCERNMGELRVSHYTFNKFWNWLHENKEDKIKAIEVYNKLNEIYNKESDEIDEYFKTLPKKVTLKQTIKKWITKKK